jgi:hypothetical protein
LRHELASQGGFLKSILFALIFASTSLHADVDQAKTYYMAGMKLQLQKQYQSAIDQYEKSLQAEPRYVYSYKQIGTCKYYLGDQPGALAAYIKYETSIPSDAATQTFINRLEATGVKPAADTENPLPAQLPSHTDLGMFPGGINLALELGYNTYAMSDYNSDIAQNTAVIQNAGGTVSGGTINGGFEVGLNAAYAFNPALKLGLDLDYLLASSQITGNLGTVFSETQSYSFPLLWIGPEFDYAFYNSGPLRIRGQLGVGYTMLVGAGSTLSATDNANPTFDTSGTQTFAGNGYGFKVGPGLDWAFNPNFLIALDLEYREAMINTITYNASITQNGHTTTQSGTATDNIIGSQGHSNASLDYSGLHAQLAADYHF